MANTHALELTKEQLARMRLLSSMGDSSGGAQVFAPVIFLIQTPNEQAQVQTAYLPVYSPLNMCFSSSGSGNIARAIARTLVTQFDCLVGDVTAFVDAAVEQSANERYSLPVRGTPRSTLTAIQSALNLSLSEVADLIGISRQTLHKWASSSDAKLRKISSYDAFLVLASVADQWTTLAGKDMPLPRWSLHATQGAPGMLEVLRKALDNRKVPIEQLRAVHGAMTVGHRLAAQRAAEQPRKLQRRTGLQILAESLERSGGGSEEP